MKNWNKFCCLFSFLAFSTPLLEAQTLTPPTLQAPFTHTLPVLGGQVIASDQWSLSAARPSFSKNLQKNDNRTYFLTYSPTTPAGTLLPPDYYPLNQQAFFCKMEMRLEKFKEVPFQVRVRVGSLQANDWLEQKPDALRPNP